MPTSLKSLLRNLFAGVADAYNFIAASAVAENGAPGGIHGVACQCSDAKDKTMGRRARPSGKDESAHTILQYHSLGK